MQIYIPERPAETPISHVHQETSPLFVLLLGSTLDLCRTSESLLSVLTLFACISRVSSRHK
jgi:hypothetical protein